ncbi:MAG: hypothetical protein ABL862_02450 [Candidatus Nitrotoga sp.]
MLQKIRGSLGNFAMAILEFLGLLGFFSGAAIAIVLGKLFAAIIFAAITLGIFLRISGRRNLPLSEPVHISPWLNFICAFLSLIEVAILTEATNLSVRLNQDGFDKQNWVLVILALLVMYFLQVRFISAVLKGQRASPTIKAPNE